MLRDFDAARLAAMRDDSWAEGAGCEGDGDLVTLVLESVPVVPVVVCDPDGRPIFDVEVVAAHDVDVVAFPFRFATSDARGRALLRLFPPLLVRFADAEVRRGVNRLGPAAPEVALDLRHLPREPVVLAIPPSGAVEVVVTDEAGSPLPAFGSVTLSWLAPPDVDTRDSRLHATPPLRDGRARFGAVLPGAAPLRVRVTPLDRPPPPRLEAPGPEAPGETVTLRVPSVGTDR